MTTGQTPSGVTSTGATLSGSFSGATGTIHEAGIVWSTSSSAIQDPDSNSNSLSWAYDTNCVGSIASGSISCTLESEFEASTTYYYRAFVAEYNASTSQYEYRYGAVCYFTTATAQPAGYEYLTGYGIPSLTGLNPTFRDSGSVSIRDDNWYGYNTSNSNRQIAIHTYTHPTSNEETMNYVVLYDKTKYAPLWTAHTMNTTQWPDNSAGRNEAWADDPAISFTQQSGLDNAGTVGYSKGHLVASEYRQSSVEQNKQTFYHSNQAPQWQNGFNGGIWNTLENRVKNQAPSGTTMLYVVTGVLYEGTTTTLPCGSLNVPIPSHFYKCIMKCTFNGSTIDKAQGIAFVYTNQSHSTATSYYGTDFNGSESFVTSIDAIETRSGFEFFPNVPTALQNSAEANTDHSWFTGVQSQSNVQSVTDNSWGTL